MEIAICTLWANAELVGGDTEKLNLIYKIRLLLKTREQRLVNQGWKVTALGQIASVEKIIDICRQKEIKYLWINLQSTPQELRKGLLAKLNCLEDMQIFLDGKLTKFPDEGMEIHKKRVEALRVMGITYLKNGTVPRINKAQQTRPAQLPVCVAQKAVL